MSPPWIEFPEYKPCCLGFRMGGGEDYMDSWWKFWGKLTDEEKAAFKEQHPSPKGWEMYYSC